MRQIFIGDRLVERDRKARVARLHGKSADRFYFDGLPVQFGCHRLVQPFADRLIIKFGIAAHDLDPHPRYKGVAHLDEVGIVQRPHGAVRRNIQRALFRNDRDEFLLCIPFGDGFGIDLNALFYPTEIFRDVYFTIGDIGGKIYLERKSFFLFGQRPEPDDGQPVRDDLLRPDVA